MQGISRMMASDVKIGGFGAYPVLPDPDSNRSANAFDLYLVQWSSEPWEVQEDEVVEVEGEQVQLRKGEWVCKGKWLYDVPRALRWYFPGDIEIIVRMQTVLNADLNLEPYTDSNPMPRMNRTTMEQVLQKNPVKMSADDWDWMMDEAHRRIDFGFEEVVEDSSDDESDEESESESEDSMSDDSESDDSEEDSDSD